MSTQCNAKWVAPNFPNIPDQLKALPFAVWKGEPKKGQPGKFNKAPCNPSTGRGIGTDKPELWGTYEEAKSAYEAGGWDGVGILLSSGCGIVGVDIDDAEDTFSAQPKARDVCKAYRSRGGYIEQSPSGNGFHGYAIGNLPSGRRKVGPLEIYDNVRFLTVTGHGAGEVRSDQEFITEFHTLLEENSKGRTKQPDQHAEAETKADDAIVERLAASMMFAEPELWSGQWEAKGYVSQSQADQALANKIAWHARKASVPDAEAYATVSAVFSRSQLGAREKWTAREDYRRSTVGKALASAGYGSEDDDESESQGGTSALAQFGSRYFVAAIGGKTLVFDRQADDIIGTAMHPTAFHHLHANKYADGGQISRKWFNSKGRETFDSITFDPSNQVTQGTFNLWRGLPVAAHPGSFHRILRHIKYVWCSGDSAQFWYVIFWMALLVQMPWIKPTVALVLRSIEGTGKTIISNILLDIFGRHGFTAAQTSQVAGNFNGHLHDKILIVMEEAMFAGDPKADSAAKVLISNSPISYEWKGGATLMRPSYHHVVILSNRDWAVPAGPDARRYAVLDVSHHRKGNISYFKALAAAIKGGGREAFLDFLLKIDVSNFDPEVLPKTMGLQQQQLETMMRRDPVRGWWLSVLAEGAYPVEGGEIPWGPTIWADEMQDSYKFFTGVGRNAQPWSTAIKQVKKLLPIGALAKTRPRNGSPGVTGGRRYEYALPSLADARAAFETVTGIDPTSC